MRETETERLVEMSVSESEYEMVSAFREIRDPEVGQMIGELIHVLSISHVADIIRLPRANDRLTVAGGKESRNARISKDAVPIDFDLVDA